mgnify:CR=1 FL=1
MSGTSEMDEVNDKGKAFVLEERIAGFASRAIAVCEALPGKLGAEHIRDQLFRASTSVAANYAEASVPESRKGFVHKMGVARKELVEARMWLKIIELREYIDAERLMPLMKETDELIRIFHSSISTARRRIREEKAASK